MAKRTDRVWPRPFPSVLGIAALGSAAVALVLLGAGPAIATMRLPAAARTTAPQMVWSTARPSSTPPALGYASAAFDSDTGTVVLFGGVEAGGALSNETWLWNGSTWSEASSQAGIPTPPARAMASMAFDPRLNQLILFGGEGAGGQLLDDTWAWNGRWWNEIAEAQTQLPSPREGAALAYDQFGNLVLFGGTGQAPQAPPPPSTTTTTTPTTTTLPSTTTTLPSSSVAPVSTTTLPPSTTTVSPPATRPLVTLGDTWIWNGTSWIPGPSGGPASRSGAALTYDSATHQTVLFGGESAPAGSTAPAAMGDTWLWTGSSWSRVATRSAPPARYGAGFVNDPSAGGPILFGGAGASGPLGDTWTWSGNSWAPTRTGGTPVASVSPAAALDSADGQVVTFGGARGAAVLGNTTLLTEAHAAPPPSAPSPAKTATHPGSTVAVGPPAIKPSTAKAPQAPTTIEVMPVTEGTGSPGSPASSPVLHRGSPVILTGKGFKPKTSVTITFHSTPAVVGQTNASSNGSFTSVVFVPADAAPGTHHFVAEGEGADGRLTFLTAAVVVAGPGLHPGTSLAETLILVLAALLFPLATWLGLGVFGRLRHGHPSA